MTPLFNIETTFDTSNNTMTQKFSKRVIVVVDWKNGFIRKYIDEVETQTIGFEKGYSLLDFIEFQLQTEQQAITLENETIPTR